MMACSCRIQSYVLVSICDALQKQKLFLVPIGIYINETHEQNSHGTRQTWSNASINKDYHEVPFKQKIVTMCHYTNKCNNTPINKWLPWCAITRRRIYLLAHRNLLWGILRLPSSHRGADSLVWFRNSYHKKVQVMEWRLQLDESSQ